MSGRSRPAVARSLRPGDWLLSLFPAALLLVLGLSLFCLEPARLPAQKVAVAVGRNASANTAAERGFSIAFDDRLVDSLAKFDEYVQARAWDKAFRILADIPEDKWSSMLPDQHGFIRPASRRVRETILELPADGREAYRLFFDAKARLLFDTVRTAQKEEDAKIARTIYDRYFITSVGDDAADWLAEDYFERGQFADAARCWKSIFDFHPNTNLPEAKILVKRAVALYRGGLEDEFRSVRQQLARDFPGTRIVLGGQEVVADTYLNGLESEGKIKRPVVERETASSEPASPGRAPPDGTPAAWQFRFLEEKDLEALEASVRNWYGAPALTSIIPAAVTDGRRLYANWLGACFAIDMASGKTVWTTHPDVKSLVSQMRTNNGRMMTYSTNSAQFTLSLGHKELGEPSGKEVVLSVSASPNQVARFHLVAYDAATGGELWTSDRPASGLAQSSFVGTPLVDGNSIFAVSHQVSSSDRHQQMGGFNGNGATASELVLRHLDLRTGSEIWSLPLGTPQFVGDPDWGQQFLPIPALVVSGGRIYVLTNDGALLAVNIGRRQIEWAYKYEPPATAGNRQRFFRPANGAGRHARSTGPIVVRDGVIYFKESTSSTLYALDEAGPRLKWKWQDSEFANLVGIDGGDVYLFSNELSAIARTKPETRWSNRLTVDLQGIGAQVGSQGILVFTPRGLFELSKETGDVRRIFRGDDLGAAGGFVLCAGKRLVCVSNVAVTAYPEFSTH
jgi:outer membrane protein assembly factor BamB